MPLAPYAWSMVSIVHGILTPPTQTESRKLYSVQERIDLRNFELDMPGIHNEACVLTRTEP